MITFNIIKTKYENDNTAEFGFGDYPRYTPYVAFQVEAETRRKAMNVAKKIDSNLSFGGQFGNQIYSNKDLPSYIK